MKLPLNLWIPAAVVAAAVAFALYASPRAYQVFVPEPASADVIPATVEPTASGTIIGTVRWKGPLPDVPKIEGGMAKLGQGPTWQSIPNPSAPKIDPATNGIANAVVMLNKVGTERKAWSYPPVSIRLQDGKIAVFQGEVETPIGFVPVGGEVEIVSKEPGYQMLRARGAAFFTQPLPRSDEPVRRKFLHAGQVDLTSAVGHVWSGADLFVCEHPYYTRTDELGRFELTNVPPGSYVIGYWLKNWKIESRDRDPETGKLMRLRFEPPLFKFLKVTVAQGQSSNVELTLP